MGGLIKEIESAFKSKGSREISVWQTNYMKGHFPFIGLQKPLRESLQKQLLRGRSFSSEKELVAMTLSLWNMPEREFHYYSLDLLRDSPFHTSSSMFKIYEQLLRTNTWWDSIDTLAAHLVGPLVRANPSMLHEMDRFSEDSSFWVRRTALLFQLRYKKNTDAQRLFSYCSKMSDEKEFFIRKAIGWALREYSKTDPDAVRAFLKSQPLSPLSRKEAEKYL